MMVLQYFGRKSKETRSFGRNPKDSLYHSFAGTSSTESSSFNTVSTAQMVAGGDEPSNNNKDDDSHWFYDFFR